VRSAEDTKATGVRNGGSELGSSNRGHARLEKRILDAEEVAEFSMQSPFWGYGGRRLSHGAATNGANGRYRARPEELSPRQNRRIVHR
jgi:hypothetical protein